MDEESGDAGLPRSAAALPGFDSRDKCRSLFKRYRLRNRLDLHIPGKQPPAKTLSPEQVFANRKSSPRRTARPPLKVLRNVPAFTILHQDLSFVQSRAWCQER